MQSAKYTKEYTQLTGSALPAGINMMQVIDAGLPIRAFYAFASLFDIAEPQALKLLGLSDQHLLKSKLPQKTFGRMLILCKLFNDATEQFGSRQQGHRWLNTPSKALGDTSSINLLDTGVGIEMVIDSLNRLQTGMTC